MTPFRLVIAPIVIAGAVLWCSAAYAQVPPPAPAAQAQLAPATRVFSSDAGLVLNFIKPDKVAQFEALVARLKEVLAKSENPVRREQAQSWKVYKSTDPPSGGAQLYVFFSDPAVKSADYSVSTILSGELPQDEASTLMRQYAECFAPGQNWVNLSLLADFGK